MDSKTYYLAAMALVPIKTASETGYCDCICGCYELASLRDEDTGKGYCPACAKDHADLNAGAGIPQPAPVNVSANSQATSKSASMPSPPILREDCGRPSDRWLLQVRHFCSHISRKNQVCQPALRSNR